MKTVAMNTLTPQLLAEMRDPLFAEMLKLFVDDDGKPLSPFANLSPELYWSKRNALASTNDYRRGIQTEEIYAAKYPCPDCIAVASRCRSLTPPPPPLTSTS